MEFNDGSMYRVVTDPARQLAERQVYMHRAASARGGAPYVDPTFEDHRRRLARMPALVYFQFAYSDLSPVTQGRFLLAALGGGLCHNEMVMLDLEPGGGFAVTNAVAFFRAWVDVVEPALHTRAWVYVPLALAAALTPAVTGPRIRVAPRYSGTAARGTAPSWPYDVHQYTDRGYFPGCPQTGDTNFTSLTPTEMLARCNPDGIATPCGS